jgi:hypothetical protein
MAEVMDALETGVKVELASASKKNLTARNGAAIANLLLSSRPPKTRLTRLASVLA